MMFSEIPKSVIWTMLFILHFCGSVVFAKWEPIKEKVLKVELGQVLNSYEFEIIANQKTTGSAAKYKPHSPTKTSLTATYGYLWATLRLVNPTNPSDDLDKGNSRSVDFQFRFLGAQSLEFVYQTYSGYYLDNSGDLDPSYSGKSQKIIRSDIATKNYGINYFHSMREEAFSIAVAFDQNGRQLESDWGYGYLASANDSIIGGDSPLVPTVVASQFGPLSDLREVNRRSLNIGAWVGGIWTKGNFYTAGFLALGFGVQDTVSEYQNSPSKRHSEGANVSSARFGLGFNGINHISGVQIFIDGVSTPIDDGKIQSATSEGKFFYAYRFE
jgi:hypothetical protein